MSISYGVSLFSEDIKEVCDELNYVELVVEMDGKPQIQQISFDMLVMLSKVPEIYDNITRLAIKYGEDFHESIEYDTGYSMGYGASQYRSRCKKVEITYIPPLPKSLEIIYIESTNITELPELPEGLVLMRCNNNGNLTTIRNIPKSLKCLMLTNSMLRDLPDISESNLEFINLSCNWTLGKISELPKTLKYINCYNCGLTKMPKLPEGIEDINFGFNKIKDVGYLPSSLICITLKDNHIKELPKLIHLKNLVTFECQNNKITYVPDLNPDIFGEDNLDGRRVNIYLNENNIKGFSYSIFDLLEKRLTICANGEQCYTHRINIESNPIANMMNNKSICNDNNEEEFINIINQYHAIDKIANMYLKAKYDPDYKMCRDRLDREQAELYEEENT